MCKGTSTNRKGERIGWEVSEGGENAAWDAGETEGDSRPWSLWPGLGSAMHSFSLGTGQGWGWPLTITPISQISKVQRLDLTSHHEELMNR